jgi:glycosyltransferase involved in cell wall biosynthesis
MPAHNAAPYIGEAIESFLAQDYPAECLDLVIVDDGSTDDTAAIVCRYAERAPGHIRLIQQENRGTVAAASAGLRAARGEFISLLDSDDVWPRDKVRRQLEALQARPEALLAYGDMTVIDADGTVLQDSWLEGDTPPSGSGLGPLLRGNPAMGSTILFRASLIDREQPIPAGIEFVDWWLILHAAEIAEILYLPEPKTLYRFHGGNQSLGAEGGRRRWKLGQTLRFLRIQLRRMTLELATPSELAEGWKAFEHYAREAIVAGGTAFDRPVDVSDEDRAAALEHERRGNAALARGDAEDAVLHFVLAAANDPWLRSAADSIQVALAATADGASLPGQTPLSGAGEFVVTARAQELLDAPELLSAYASGMSGLSGVTLAIDASQMEPNAAAAAVSELVEAADVDDDAVDILALVGALDPIGRARLAAGTHAVYGGEQAEGPRPPAFTPATIPALRVLAAERL